MKAIASNHVRAGATVALAVVFLLAVTATQAHAFPQTQNAWEARYGAQSNSGTNAQCQLCHGNANGGDPWNGYGWDIRDALANFACDLNGNSVVSNEEAFFCVEMDNSDNDGSNYDNLAEIGLSTQPGWTNGNFNTLYFKSGLVSANQPPPAGIGQLDPDGTEPPPPPPPPPPDDTSDLPPGQTTRNTIVVKPGESIQAAIDQAEEGTTIYVLAGTYSEVQNPTNGLNITKNGIRLVGQKTPNKRVVFENAGNQRNGIVVVPPDRTDCMSCHTDMAPPFPLKDGVEGGLSMRDPMMYGIEVRSITIRGFQNNGLFTENVDGFRIIDVESIDNKNYGIFPTLSKNGLVINSKASGSDDSGIWVETSENVLVTQNLAEGNVNGFEVSNSDDIMVVDNETRNNTVGMAILLLPDIFDDRPGAKRINLIKNKIHDNNKVNTARPGSILATVPSGTGVIHLGVDDSVMKDNLIQNNKFTGIALVDYCLAVQGTPFDCSVDPSVTPGFVADQAATGNIIVSNTLVNNGTNPDPHPFAFAAADLTLLSTDPFAGNCYANNTFTTFFSLFGFLPPCP